MSRTIKEIYNEAVAERNPEAGAGGVRQRLQAVCHERHPLGSGGSHIQFRDPAGCLRGGYFRSHQRRINGTPAYYANALLQYQQGDELTVREDGLAFGYPNVDESKRIITQVSYVESTDDRNLDSKLILKVATGTKGNLSAIPPEDLVPINAYIGKLKFAGTRVEVISTKGDVLIPRLTVFHDGAVPESEVYDAIEEQLNAYMMEIDFDAAVYVSRLTDAVRRAEHVTDVHIDENAVPEQGIFIASHDTDGHIRPPQRVARMTHTASGYLKESSGKDEEAGLPNFREAIILKIENHEV